MKCTFPKIGFLFFAALAMTAMLFGVSFTSTTAQANPQFNKGQILLTQTPDSKQSLPLSVVDPKAFCKRIQTQFANYGRQAGYSKLHTAMLASAAPTAIIKEFKDGRSTDFINTQALSQYASVPHRGGSEEYLPVAEIISNAMGFPKKINLALSVGELRFIPFAKKGIDLVVIAKSTVALSEARAKKVADIAKKSKIKISVIWMGNTKDYDDQLKAARKLAWLAATTGGSFANLSDAESKCSLSS